MGAKINYSVLKNYEFGSAKIPRLWGEITSISGISTHLLQPTSDSFLHACI